MLVVALRSWSVRSIAVGAVAVGLASACVALGTWQWDRAHSRAAARVAADPVSLSEVLAPSTDAHGANGTAVWTTGAFGDDLAIVTGREVDDRASIMLVRSFDVSAEYTGTGEPATLAVVVGFASDAGVANGVVECPSIGEELVTVTGYLRASESPPVPGSGSDARIICGVSETTAISTADLAQTWPAPMYSAVFVSTDGAPGWEPVPRPPLTADLNLQSLAYSFEWWAFAAFALVVAARWIRDNGREQTNHILEARRDG